MPSVAATLWAAIASYGRRHARLVSGAHAQGRALLRAFHAGGAIRGGASHSGAGGAKGGDQGKCGPAKHVPRAEPGKRVTSAGSHTESRKGKEEGEVHRALPSHQYRSARRGILRTQGECRAGC